jgi:uncharacterized membrane protein
MATVTESVDVNVPVDVAFDQWTRFEQFPTFMEGVQEVTRIDDTHMHWVAEIGGKRHEWDAEMIDVQPNHRIAWRSTSGLQNDGVVTFEPVETGVTRVKVEFEHDAEGMVEKIGSVLGVDDRQVQADLQRYKDKVEAQGSQHEVAGVTPGSTTTSSQTF